MAEHTVDEFHREATIASLNMGCGDQAIDGLIGRCAGSFDVLQTTKCKKAGTRH
jgi:hypothetical protein